MTRPRAGCLASALAKSTRRKGGSFPCSVSAALLSSLGLLMLSSPILREFGIFFFLSFSFGLWVRGAGEIASSLSHRDIRVLFLGGGVVVHS